MYSFLKAFSVLMKLLSLSQFHAPKCIVTMFDYCNSSQAIANYLAVSLETRFLTLRELAYDIFVLQFRPKKQQFSVALPMP